MNLSIKTRIYWSFSLLVSLFVINGIITLVVLNNNKKASKYISAIADPSIEALHDFRRVMRESVRCATNWVFIPSDGEYKKDLKDLQASVYPALKTQLSSLSANWYDKSITDSLQIIFAGFDQVISDEKSIMIFLEKFNDYNDPIKESKAEDLLESKVIPQTTTLTNSLNNILLYEKGIKAGEETKFEHASAFLRTLISFLAITIICLGIFFSLYMTKKIINPVKMIRLIINALGKGITHEIEYDGKADEIGEMVHSVNHLSEKLQATATFATEIGNKNFDSYFEPLGTEDTLGKALVVMRDNLKSSERELLDMNRELTILFNSVDEIFFSVNMVTLKVIQISATCEKVYGYKQSEFLANHRLWFEIIHPDDKQIVDKEEAIMRRGELIHNQYRIIRKDKTIRWVENKITPTLDENGNLIRVDGLTRDITERINAEAELHKSEERYRQIVETAQEGIWLIDENNQVVFVNKKMCEMLEYTPEEIIGKQNYYFKDDEEKKKAAEQIERRKRGISETHDSKYMTKSGKPVWGHVSTNPVFNKEGEYKGALAMVTDITQRKLDEESLKRSEANLEIKNKELEQKNKELEQFAYVASHDLQEPLRTTSSFVELLRQQYYGQLDKQADKYLAYILQSSDRMMVLISDLLDYSRIGNKKELQQVDCNIILQEVLDDLGKTIKDEQAAVKAEQLPVISGYQTEIKQLFQNLIVNAIKFRKKDTAPQVSISARKDAACWTFAIRDNGIGIAEDHKDRIFIIFQRLHTRTEYEGSGIGLAHCKKIVDLHGGKIWVESKPDQGATFHFNIPEISN